MTCQPSKCMSRDCPVSVCMWVHAVCFFASRFACAPTRWCLFVGVCFYRMCARRELCRYLNGSLRNVLPFLRSCHLPDSQTANQPTSQPAWVTDWLTVCLSGRWQWWGVVRGTQGYVLPEVKEWWPSLQQENAPVFKRKNNHCLYSGAFLSVWCVVSVWNDGS